MKFDELDARLRVFETAHDLCVLPGLFMVARIDGRNFTRLTKETHKFEGESYQKEATNPRTGEKVLATRRRIKVDMELSMKDDYSNFVRDLIVREHPQM